MLKDSGDKTNNLKSLEPFFKPASVAIVGASRVPGKAGYNIIENLKGLGYRGKIYAVNPQARRILGQTVYPDVNSLPETPELAIIVLPPGQVLKPFQRCIAKGILAVLTIF